MELVEDTKVLYHHLSWFCYQLVSINFYEKTYFFLLYAVLQDVEELMSLPPEKMLLKWMNFHLKKAGYKKPVTNFSSDLKVNTGIFE